MYFVYDFTCFFTSSLCRITQWECDLAHTLESLSCGKEQHRLVHFWVKPIARFEDWPVMPVDMIGFALKSADFLMGIPLSMFQQRRRGTVNHIESKEAEQY